MKPTSPLKKISIAGMLASCIFLVNCGQPTDHSKEEAMKKLALELQLPSCSDDTMKLLRQRSTLFSSIREILAGTLDDAQKTRVQTFIDEVYTKSKSIMSNVRTTKVQGFPASGCTFKENESEIKYQLDVIKTEDLALAKRVSEANDKKPNEILLHAQPTWKVGDKLTISANLAPLLSDERFVNGRRMILNGQVVNGGNDFLNLKMNRTTSLCISATIDGQDTPSGTVSEISNLTARLDNKERLVQDLKILIPSMTGSRSLMLSCILADGSDLNDAMVETFGQLLVKAEAPTTQTVPAPMAALGADNGAE